MIELARAHADKPYLWEGVTVAHANSANRSDAVEAARQLMADRAGWMDADMEISVNVRSALEWRPEELEEGVRGIWGYL